MADKIDSRKISHTLKTDPDVFQLVWDGLKTFEIRKNDRNFQPGDTLQLAETVYTGKQMKDSKPLKYTGRVIVVHVTHVMHGPVYGLRKGWVIMSIK